VLARKARQAAAGKDLHAVDEAWVEVELHFAIELAPHFQIEESLIAPHLEAAGDLGLTKRLFEEHRALRAFVRPVRARSSADLLRFGELLDTHIRFEESELFEVAQKRLSPEALGAIAEACRANRSGR
jgi:hemerythrin-like domain-containing protein